MRHLIVLILLFISPCLLAQDTENWRTINSVSEWIEEINSSTDSVYRATNLIVRLDFEKDQKIASYRAGPEGRTKGGEDLEDLLVVNKAMVLSHIRFIERYNSSLSNNTFLRNLHFKKPVRIYYLENNRFGFEQCTFDDLLQIRLIETRFFMRFNASHFKGPVIINNPYSPTSFEFVNCTSESVLYLSSDGERPSLSMVESQFYFLELGPRTDFREVILLNSTFLKGVSLERINILSNLFMKDVSTNYLDITGAGLPAENTYLPFDSLKNSLCISLAGSRNKGQRLSEPFQGNSEEELMDFFQMDILTGSYTKLLNVYKSRGEMRSYNAAYIEMRDKHTAQSRLIYLEDANFQNFFDWQINRFTKSFSDYGTRPAKAILIFFQVVLAFSIFYFFFPSSWNTTNSRKLMKRLSYLGSYFQSQEGLSDLFEKETKEEFQDYEEFRSFMTSSQKQLPVYFQWLSKPLYHASVSRFNLSRGILKRTEILNGKWSELPSGKKAITSFLIGIYLLIYLIYVLLVRCLNAITLSLNAFSTLGFGEIPTKGLARYVTIIQGFVGWFLLSIFLVSLIGQILN